MFLEVELENGEGLGRQINLLEGLYQKADNVSIEHTGIFLRRPLKIPHHDPL